MAVPASSAAGTRPLGAGLAKYLQGRLFWLAAVAIALGWLAGAAAPETAGAWQRELGTAMNVIVFAMIYPMMMGLHFRALAGVMKQPRPLLLSLVYNFGATPLLAWLLLQLFGATPELALGFYLVMLIPGTSMAMAYTGMAGGSLEVAAVTQAAGFIVAPFALPLYLHAFAQGQSIAVPLDSLAVAMATVLVLPMIAGALTRHFLVKAYGPPVMERIKPLLGIVTVVCMLLLIGLIFFAKGAALTHNVQILLPLLAATATFMFLILALMTFVDRWLGLSYGEHMAVAFVSSGKNNATAIAVAVSVAAFSPLVAIPAAILPLFQIVMLLGYLRLTPWLRSYYASNPPANLVAKEMK